MVARILHFSSSVRLQAGEAGAGSGPGRQLPTAPGAQPPALDMVFFMSVMLPSVFASPYSGK